jgi:hypothetical protein
MAPAAKQASSQILAASSTGEASRWYILKEEYALTSKESDCADRTNAHKPMAHSKTQASPPILVWAGAAIRVIEKTANANDGKAWRRNALVFLFYDLKL